MNLCCLKNKWMRIIYNWRVIKIYEKYICNLNEFVWYKNEHSYTISNLYSFKLCLSERNAKKKTKQAKGTDHLEDLGVSEVGV
jgi:hypothetical protein